jgi:hypothetical protein
LKEAGFIDAAQESLDIAVQEIDSEIIAQAILDARWRGVSVRVFPKHSYLQTDLTDDDIAEIGNRPERLTAHWIEPRPSLTSGPTGTSSPRSCARTEIDPTAVPPDLVEKLTFDEEDLVRKEAEKAREILATIPNDAYQRRFYPFGL